VGLGGAAGLMKLADTYTHLTTSEVSINLVTASQLAMARAIPSRIVGVIVQSSL